MFSNAGRIVDVFIPVEQGTRKNMGFVFVRFATNREAEKAMDLAMGRSWGGCHGKILGRKIQANMALF